MKSQYQSNCIILEGVTAVGMIVINVEEFDSELVGGGHNSRHDTDSRLARRSGPIWFVKPGLTAFASPSPSLPWATRKKWLSRSSSSFSMVERVAGDQDTAGLGDDYRIGLVALM